MKEDLQTINGHLEDLNQQTKMDANTLLRIGDLVSKIRSTAFRCFPKLSLRFQ